MKRYISIFCILTLILNIFIFLIPVKADGIPAPGYTELKEIQQDIENGDNRTLQDIWNTLQPIGSAIGVVMNPVQTIEFIRDIVDPVAETLPNYPTDGTQVEKDNFVSDYLINNTTINDSSKNYTLNQNARNLVNGVINNFISETGTYYVYSKELTGNAGIFPSTEAYQAFKQLCENYQTGNIVTWQKQYNRALIISLSNNSCVHYGYGGGDCDVINVYNNSNWQTISGRIFDYDSVNKYYYDTGNTEWANPYMQKTQAGKAWNEYYWYGARMCFTFGGVHRYLVYKTLSSLQSSNVGEAPYYYNNTVNTNYNNTTGDFTVTTDNSNHATYSGVIEYNQQYYDDHSYYPTIENIENYIENVSSPTPTPTPTPTLTPDNPSGGGNASASATANNSGVNVTVNNNHNISFNVPGLSGNGIGNGTVSGNGTGTGGIFDWISDIGGVIGEFIKNVGSLIADVIKGITETITTILADIPNIISVLVEFVYGGLPDELKAIVTLGITTVIFVGVIKMMRK